MKTPTRLIHQRGARLDPPTVNPPIERGSTLLMKTRQDLYSRKPGYGRMGLTVQRELEAALCALEDAEFARLTPSGLSACTLAIASVVSAGDHILFPDTVYGPTRRFCERRLAKMGVSATRYPARIGAEIEGLIRPETRAIFLESPGSLTFEIADTPAIVEVAKRRGLVTLMDNTWSGGHFHKPLRLGVDMSIQALTKYAAGHADAFGGAIMVRNDALAKALVDTSEDWGISLGPDDSYAALRGLRTLALRLQQHRENGIEIAHWLEAHDQVASVIHPALASHPDHTLWKRDFTGSSGLFAFVATPMASEEIDTFLETLKLFAMGFSWGGYESMLIPCDEQLSRLKDDWSQQDRGPLFRLHAGLEDPGDLIADLDAAFQAACDRNKT